MGVRDPCEGLHGALRVDPGSYCVATHGWAPVRESRKIGRHELRPGPCTRRQNGEKIALRCMSHTNSVHDDDVKVTKSVSRGLALSGS